MIGPVGLGGLLLASIVALSCFGLPVEVQPSLGPLGVVFLLLTTGPIVAAYLLGAFGLGRPLAALLAPRSIQKLWVQLGLGLAAMLWLSHTLGVLGLLSGPGMLPRIVGWSVPGIGLLLALDQLIRGPLRPEKWPILPASAIVWGPGIALLIVAASSPPGGVWGPKSSEFGAFDAISYHLQLPKEWAAGARLAPSDHNVYSYLPSLVESAYLHLGAMMPGPADPVQRMLGGEGTWVMGCQLLHAGLAVAGSLLTARAASVLVSRCGVDERAAATLGVLAGAFTLCTPWVIVTGSLPYNEAGVLGLGAAGVLLALDMGIAPWARGTAAGLAVGVACGCKPTALFMVGPVVGLLLLGYERVGNWARMIVAGAAAGVLAVAPWLIRNWLACGNPVFPFASGIFGTGHWTAEQVARHAGVHHAPPGTGVGERLARLVSAEFGLMHAQWGIALAGLIVALGVALMWKRSHLAAMLLGAGVLVQMLCWMLLTHLQSRFLMPLLTPIALLLALAGAALVSWVGRSGARGRFLSRTALVVLALAPLSQALRSTFIFMEQNNWRPNHMLPYGVGVITGEAMKDRLAMLDDAARAKALLDIAPASYINLKIRPQESADAGVYLLGDTAPLYFLGADGRGLPSGMASPSSPVIYCTTWDAPLIAGVAVGAPGANPHPWSVRVRESGCRYILANYAELDRLIKRDHYFDPAITYDAIIAWLHAPESHIRSVMKWQELGVELLEIDLPARTTPAGVVQP